MEKGRDAHSAMDLGLKGKVAIVGGASKGLGRACAEVLAEEGARVAVCSRTQADLEQDGGGDSRRGPARRCWPSRATWIDTTPFAT